MDHLLSALPEVSRTLPIERHRQQQGLDLTEMLLQPNPDRNPVLVCDQAEFLREKMPMMRKKTR